MLRNFLSTVNEEPIIKGFPNIFQGLVINTRQKQHMRCSFIDTKWKHMHILKTSNLIPTKCVAMAMKYL